jgi:ATP-dependent Clp protease ATP-binding subunit ClpA
MFQRYTTETKRAIYFAAQCALFEGSAQINSTHLLHGLVTDHESRANTVFRIREILPEETARQADFESQNAGNQCNLVLRATSPRTLSKRRKQQSNEISLGPHGKRILGYTARAANELHDYWIDTEHLVLGILTDNKSAGAARLRQGGLQIASSRQRAMENKSSRTARPNPVLWWPGEWKCPFGLMAVALFTLGVTAGLVWLARMRGQ